MKHPVPEEIRLQKDKNALVLVYGSEVKKLPAEYLRVYSPSAEVRGHAPGQETLQTGKINVCIAGLEPVGQYALKIIFSDGHDSGLYDWDYLYQLACEYDTMWADYLRRLEAAGASREASTESLSEKNANGCASGGCGKH
ncbi:gamma-butyrobetaine hydroxylase-like domain-containing protein [Neisseria sp. 83E34]|uniref:gamma-butyrobetaine hydroxylase-like domain-containing protein n=1 Tax=Neisseria sp. 83E34 TaxID=1692264 RepID=UPI000ACA691C